MTDLLVKLYDLPEIPAVDGCEIRRALTPERGVAMSWVQTHFTPGWAQEVASSFSTQPVRCFLAIEKDQLLGFSCFNTTFQGFFGPIGVRKEARGRGIGTALTIRALHAMHEEGFAYGIIGATKAEEYYQQILGAIPIPDSWPGAYRGMLDTRA
ncbi:MAG: GNAT family N-acetyltransferase [Verrucomicrobiota bacterium]